MLTRKELETRAFNHGTITRKEYETFNPKSIKYKGISRYADNKLYALFRFETASRIDGTYWLYIEIKD